MINKINSKKIKSDLHLIIPKTIKISDTKLNLGGQDILPTHKTNHQKERTGIQIIPPFISKTLREPQRSYIKFNKQNKPEEQIP